MPEEVEVRFDGDVWRITDLNDHVNLVKNDRIIVHARKDQGDEVMIFMTAVRLLVNQIHAAVEDMVGRREAEG